MEKFRITVEELPELETAVAISGSAKQQEVGGTLCLVLGVGVALAVGMARS